MISFLVSGSRFLRRAWLYWIPGRYSHIQIPNAYLGDACCLSKPLTSVAWNHLQFWPHCVVAPETVAAALQRHYASEQVNIPTVLWYSLCPVWLQYTMYVSVIFCVTVYVGTSQPPRGCQWTLTTTSSIRFSCRGYIYEICRVPGKYWLYNQLAEWRWKDWRSSHVELATAIIFVLYS